MSTTIAFDSIPAELRARRQWVVWRAVERDGKQTKIPYRSDGGGRASTTDPTTWSSFEAAVAAADALAVDGIGFVFAPDDGFVGVDLDELNADTAAVMAALNSYTERSASGVGFHVIVRASLNGHPRNRTGPIEVYEQGRYFAMTGAHEKGSPTTIEERQAELDEVLARFLPIVASVRATTVVASRSAADIDDTGLIERACAAKNGGEFYALWTGVWESRYASQSEADLALASHLAFWTDRDPDRIDRLFRASGLMRGKWQRDDYRRRTIDTAIAGCHDVYEPRRSGGATSTDSNATVHIGNDGESESPESFSLVALTTRQVCALPDPPGSDELLGPLLVRAQRLILGAHTGEGKTTATLQIVRAVVLKESFLDWRGNGGRALVIDAEQGLKTIKRRLQEAGLADSDLIDYVRVPDGLQLDSDERHVAEVERLLEVGDYAVVAADPLYKLHAGDSNAEREAVDLMRLFDGWREQHGFALLLPVHCRKPVPGMRFTIHDLFGSSAYVRGAEVVVGLQRVRDGYSKLHWLKDRDGDLPIGTSWGLLFDRDNGFRRDPEDGKREPTTAEQVRELLEATPWMTKAALAATTGKAERTIQNALRELYAVSRRPEGEGGRADHVYALPDEDGDAGADVQPIDSRRALWSEP